VFFRGVRDFGSVGKDLEGPFPFVRGGRFRGKGRLNVG
jgi:hypothetical protein